MTWNRYIWEVWLYVCTDIFCKHMWYDSNANQIWLVIWYRYIYHRYWNHAYYTYRTLVDTFNWIIIMLAELVWWQCNVGFDEKYLSMLSFAFDLLCSRNYWSYILIIPLHNAPHTWNILHVYMNLVWGAVVYEKLDKIPSVELWCHP